jgi:hypothetical protein
MGLLLIVVTGRLRSICLIMKSTRPPALVFDSEKETKVCVMPDIKGIAVPKRSDYVDESVALSDQVGVFRRTNVRHIIDCSKGVLTWNQNCLSSCERVLFTVENFWPDIFGFAVSLCNPMHMKCRSFSRICVLDFYIALPRRHLDIPFNFDSSNPRTLGFMQGIRSVRICAFGGFSCFLGRLSSLFHLAQLSVIDDGNHDVHNNGREADSDKPTFSAANVLLKLRSFAVFLAGVTLGSFSHSVLLRSRWSH